MKKVLFLSLAASAVMASCSNEVLDSVVPQEPQAISFENPFLDKGTRADLTESNLKSFYVFSKNGNGDVYTGDKISKTNNQWTSDPVQYWVPDQTYSFAAYSNGEEGTGADNLLSDVSFNGSKLTVANYTNENGTKDLVCSQVITGESANNHIKDHTTVGLTFGHKLSKVYFTFTSDAVAGQTLTLENITLNNVNSIGQYEISNPTNEQWTGHNTEKAYSYTTSLKLTPAAGEAKPTQSTVEKLNLIPQTLSGSDITVTFKATLKSEKPNASGQSSIEKTITVNLPAGEWLINHVYNYTAHITRANITLGEPIIFTPKVNGWEEDTNIEVPGENIIK